MDSDPHRSTRAQEPCRIENPLTTTTISRILRRLRIRCYSRVEPSGDPNGIQNSGRLMVSGRFLLSTSIDDRGMLFQQQDCQHIPEELQLPRPQHPVLSAKLAPSMLVNTITTSFEILGTQLVRSFHTLLTTILQLPSVPHRSQPTPFPSLVPGPYSPPFFPTNRGTGLHCLSTPEFGPALPQDRSGTRPPFII